MLMGTYGLNSIIDFGKTHRGDTIRTILEKDPDWVEFAVENGVIELDNEAFRKFSEGKLSDE